MTTICSALAKLEQHCWSYIIMHITDLSAIKLHNLDGTYVTGMVNGSRLKMYYETHYLSGYIVNKKMRGQNM